MLVPHEMLSQEALRGLIEEFVTRDGTELSDAEKKVAQVLRLLEAGKVAVSYDEDSETCSIMVVE